MIKIKASGKNVKIKLGAGSIYPALEDLVVNPTGTDLVFTHPNSYGYDKVTVKKVQADTIDITPTFEVQTFNGLYSTINVAKINVPYEEFYIEEVEEWI